MKGQIRETRLNYLFLSGRLKYIYNLWHRPRLPGTDTLANIPCNYHFRNGLGAYIKSVRKLKSFKCSAAETEMCAKQLRACVAGKIYAHAHIHIHIHIYMYISTHKPQQQQQQLVSTLRGKFIYNAHFYAGTQVQSKCVTRNLHLQLQKRDGGVRGERLGRGEWWRAFWLSQCWPQNGRCNMPSVHIYGAKRVKYCICVCVCDVCNWNAFN